MGIRKNEKQLFFTPVSEPFYLPTYPQPEISPR